MTTVVRNVNLGYDGVEKSNSFANLEMLAMVAEKIYDDEHKQKQRPIVDMPIVEKKPLPFDLNVKPRTPRKPRSTPIDVHALLPCLHHECKLQENDQDNIDFEKKPLPFDLNVKPRTPRKPRSTPIDVHALLPCLNHECKLQENDQDNRGFEKTRLIIHLKQPELPLEYCNKIVELNGFDLKLVIHKKLHKSDVSKKKGRLSMPFSKCWVDFGDIGEMKVKVIQPAKHLSNMILTFARLDVNSSYVLTGLWNDVVEANDLKKGDLIQVWSFRQHDELSFALVKL